MRLAAAQATRERDVDLVFRALFAGRCARCPECQIQPCQIPRIRGEHRSQVPGSCWSRPRRARSHAFLPLFPRLTEAGCHTTFLEHPQSRKTCPGTTVQAQSCPTDPQRPFPRRRALWRRSAFDPRRRTWPHCSDREQRPLLPWHPRRFQPTRSGDPASVLRRSLNMPSLKPASIFSSLDLRRRLSLHLPAPPPTAIRMPRPTMKQPAIRCCQSLTRGRRMTHSPSTPEATA